MLSCVTKALFMLLATTCNNTRIEEKKMNADFTRSLALAVQTTGAAYKDARHVLVHTLEFDTDLQRVIKSSRSWEEVWVARIAIGWRQNADLYHDAEVLIDGQLSGPKPITGKFSVGQRIKAVAGLGPEVAPRLIEMVWKTKEYNDDMRLGTVFGVLGQLGLSDIAPPLRTLLTPTTPSIYRHAAITTLGQMHDGQVFSQFKMIARNAAETEGIRLAALNAYSQYDQPELYGFLSSILRNSREPEELRDFAAGILIKREDPDTRLLFHEIIRTSSEGQLLITVADGLRKHGNKESLPLLEALKKRTSDEVLHEVIDETIESIKNK